MGDSDDEYDRKRRDKFQGERNESYRPSDRRKDEDPWSGRSRIRTDYRDRYGQSYQGDIQPAKRMRYDMRLRYMEAASGGYGGGGGGGGGYGGGGGGGGSWGGGGGGGPGGGGGGGGAGGGGLAEGGQQNYQGNNSRGSDMETQPPIMTFKAFLQTQDDNITDEEAISKYAEYKLEFRRQQLNEFFVAHKEEEWFKLKYHPEESQKRKDEHLNSLKKRAEVFLEMLRSDRMTDVRVEADGGDAVVKLLDAVVIRLEGGSDLDLTILEQQQVHQGPSGAIATTTPSQGATSVQDSNKEDKKDSGATEVGEALQNDKDVTEGSDVKKKSPTIEIGDEGGGGEGEKERGNNHRHHQGDEGGRKRRRTSSGDSKGDTERRKREEGEDDEPDRRSVSMEVVDEEDSDAQDETVPPDASPRSVTPTRSGKPDAGSDRPRIGKLDESSKRRGDSPDTTGEEEEGEGEPMDSDDSDPSDGEGRARGKKAAKGKKIPPVKKEGGRTTSKKATADMDDNADEENMNESFNKGNKDLDDGPPGVDPESDMEEEGESNKTTKKDRGELSSSERRTNRNRNPPSSDRGDDGKKKEIKREISMGDEDRGGEGDKGERGGGEDEAIESDGKGKSMGEGGGIEGERGGNAKEKKVEVIDDNASETDDVVPLTPRPLHRTSSIFLRTISPRITKTEIETICKRYPGFLRVSLADPQPEQHWFRRGWVTFRRDVNVKEICWNLNNIRVRDCELGAIVNRDLSRRVRTVSGLSALKLVVLHDVKLCVKLIQDLDSRGNLWKKDDESDPAGESERNNGASSGKKKYSIDTPAGDEAGERERKFLTEEELRIKREEESFGLVSDNPILKGITDFLVDEASAEEEELLGREAVAEESKERVNQAIKVLDRLLLYLRIVHSVDFYNQSHYPNEDEMPNRCGIMHLRGTPSSNEVSAQEISEYTEGFRSKLTSLLAAPSTVEDSEMSSLGAKSQESEVEKFILANTQELAKDKWLCPLSGKKFRGPEFVRKHIFNKFANELEEVKKEVDYFNNYLRDPKRPQLAEHPGNRAGKKDPFGADSGGGYNQPFGFGGGYYRGRGGGGGNFGHFGPGGNHGGRGRGFMRGRPMDYRPVITYRDLDAPCEPEEII